MLLTQQSHGNIMQQFVVTCRLILVKHDQDMDILKVKTLLSVLPLWL